MKEHTTFCGEQINLNVINMEMSITKQVDYFLPEKFKKNHLSKQYFKSLFS